MKVMAPASGRPLVLETDRTEPLVVPLMVQLEKVMGPVKPPPALMAMRPAKEQLSTVTFMAPSLPGWSASASKASKAVAPTVTSVRVAPLTEERAMPWRPQALPRKPLTVRSRTGEMMPLEPVLERKGARVRQSPKTWATLTLATVRPSVPLVQMPLLKARSWR